MKGSERPWWLITFGTPIRKNEEMTKNVHFLSNYRTLLFDIDLLKLLDAPLFEVHVNDSNFLRFQFSSLRCYNLCFISLINLIDQYKIYYICIFSCDWLVDHDRPVFSINWVIDQSKASWLVTQGRKLMPVQHVFLIKRRIIWVSDILIMKACANE